LTPVFNAADPATWPEAMTLDQIAEVFQRTPIAVREARRRGVFRPAAMDGYPLRWRKVEVLRHLGHSTRAQVSR
jgi:hypothetical protein